MDCTCIKLPRWASYQSLPESTSYIWEWQGYNGLDLTGVLSMKEQGPALL